MTLPQAPVRRSAAAALLLIALAGGCTTSEITEEAESDLKRSVLASTRREAADAADVKGMMETTRESGVSRLGISQKQMDELDKEAGPTAYGALTVELMPDLAGRPQRAVAISLERAVKSCVQNNLAVQFARLSPAVSQAQVVNAESAFDWVFFSNVTYNNLDQPRAAQSVNNSTLGLSTDVQQNVQSQTGLRQRLISGGQLTLQQDLSYTDVTTPGLRQVPDPSTTLGMTMQLDQPLLRNFGSEVALAEVRINRNAERNSIASLKRDLIKNVTDTERTYWQLVRAHRDLQILKRLFDRGVAVRDQLTQRTRIDATPAQIADATARVERRRGDLIRAQISLRNASDRLKALINDPDLPVGADIMVLPTDNPIDQPVQFSLLDSIESAIAYRPEVTQAIISIDDTSIRQVVADSARLPQLDLRLLTRWWALQENAGDTYSDVFDGNFVDYVVGLAFEQPIGNRKGESEFRRRRLERMQAVISYRNTIQQVMLEVKTSLDNAASNYRLIDQTRISRIAASEVLRALRVEIEKLRGFTTERLDLQLNKQELLAQAERDEVQALTDYQIALADVYAATGRTLERNRIEFVVPNVEEALRSGPDPAQNAGTSSGLPASPAPGTAPAAPDRPDSSPPSAAGSDQAAPVPESAPPPGESAPTSPADAPREPAPPDGDPN